ncbi:MAG TPA: hypothetical protein VFN35_03570 [Ktedonobacteraceae bacterium]|nr:hypothetical protein [Ktedonobacteraceae bacterium]
MIDLNFRQPVSIDNAPKSRQCEWCGKPAVYQLTVQGGLRHNKAGLFCQACGEEFIRIIADTLDREPTPDAAVVCSSHY